MKLQVRRHGGRRYFKHLKMLKEESSNRKHMAANLSLEHDVLKDIIARRFKVAGE